MARMREAEGDLDGALDLLDEAERLYVGDFFPNVRPVPAVRARVLIAPGASWARPSAGRASEACRPTTTSATCASSSTSRWPGCSWPGTRRARGAPRPRRTRLLDRLLRAAEAGGPDGQRHRDPDAAGARPPGARRRPGRARVARRALTLAEPEGYVRIFVDEGPPMASLLQAFMKQGASRTRGRCEQRMTPAYVRRLLAAISKTGDSTPVTPGLIEPLSERELDVLRLLGTRPGRPGDRSRARRVAEHRAHAHQEHLRQARCEQPPGSGPPRRGTRPVAPRQPLIPRSPPQSPHVVMRPHHLPLLPFDQQQQLKGGQMNEIPTGPHDSPAGTRSASRGTSMPDGRPGSTD